MSPLERAQVRVDLLRLVCRPGLTPHQIVAFAMELETYVLLDSKGREVDTPRADKATAPAGTGKDWATKRRNR